MNDYKSLIDNTPASFSKLTTGTSNQIYASNELLIRKKIINEVDKNFNLPETEFNIYKSLKGNRIAPTLFYFDENGNKVEEFIKSREFDKNNKEDIIKVANVIKELHALPIFDNQDEFNLMQRLSFYKKDIESPFKEEKQIVRRAINIINSSKQVVSHNDLWSGNILIDENRAYLIDFEFASINSYYFDLASLIEENALDKEMISYFLDQFDLDEKEIRDIYALIPFLDILWYYWALARYKETSLDNFLNIANSKKAYYLDNLDFFL